MSALLVGIVFATAMSPYELARRWPKSWLVVLFAISGIAASALVAAIFVFVTSQVWPEIAVEVFKKSLRFTPWALAISPVSAFMGWKKAEKQKWSRDTGGSAMGKRYWKISGYDGTKTVFEKILDTKEASEDEIRVLLQRLASRHLSDDEIVASSLRKNSIGYQPHLELTRDLGGKFCLYTAGSGVHYAATIAESET